MQKWGKWVKLQKEELEAGSNYQKYKKAFYDAMNVALVEGKITKSGKIFE